MTPHGWQLKEWGELAELRYGRALANYREQKGTTRVYGTNGPVGTTLIEPQSPGPGVIVGRKGAYRGIHYSPGPFFVIDTAFWLSPVVKLDMRWAYYELLTHDINTMDSGSAIPSTSRDAFYKMPVTVPPFAEQQLIAATLSALDNKIASNLRAIALAEELGDSLLRSRMRFDSEGAPVWASSCVGELLATLETGSRPRGGIKDVEDGVVSLGAENVQAAGVAKGRRFKYVSRAFADAMTRGRLSEGDILVYKDGGKPGNFVPHVSAFGHGFPVEEAVINEHVYRIRAAEGVSQGLLYWTLRSEWLDRAMRDRGTGAAIPGLNSTNFKSLPFPLLDADEQREVGALLDSMLERMLRQGAEIASLTRLRDTLLPALISGSLRVNQTAGAAEAAAA
jgi:type I restriction enzyme, S subunit